MNITSSTDSLEMRGSSISVSLIRATLQ